ncbi:MAG: multiple sugar transport system permease protein [Thermomicrobiales bacterium]|jgi:multiple sugar transport system permease protein|nr:multiple sugar transport system permease protein [Thermomicrobiales bacterium]MEA2583790.1 multiple sugar transport system permease protein [Thermomicrobiales bacterium]MEA2595765.1 multiple sugar transport system permease protein [Thermomicrobiales bacterium]
MATIGGRRMGMTPLKWREARAGYLFVLPWILGLLIFTAYPVISAFYLSFTDYNVLEPPKWVGLDNYDRMFTLDPSFWTSVKNSAFYAAFSVPLRLLFALAIALLLNLGARGIGVYRTLYYLPTLVPPVVSTIVFILLFESRNGLVNIALGAAGLPTPGWLIDPDWSKPTIVIMSLWSVGIETLIFLAGLKEIPQDLLDAAAVDGAGRWSRFRNITIPLLSPVILFNLVIGVIYSFQVFTQALVVGGTIGEPVDSTLMYMVVIYLNAFRYFAMGYASALAVVLFLAVLAITLLIFRSARIWVYYEEGAS